MFLSSAHITRQSISPPLGIRLIDMQTVSKLYHLEKIAKAHAYPHALTQGLQYTLAAQQKHKSSFCGRNTVVKVGLSN